MAYGNLIPTLQDIEKAAGRNEIFQAYENRFRMPQVRPAELGTLESTSGDLLNMNEPPYPLPYEWGNAYYSFDYGPAKHVVISAYSSMEPDSQQYRWLVQELDGIDRELSPWVLVTTGSTRTSRTTFCPTPREHGLLWAHSCLSADQARGLWQSLPDGTYPRYRRC